MLVVVCTVIVPPPLVVYSTLTKLACSPVVVLVLPVAFNMSAELLAGALAKVKAAPCLAPNTGPPPALPFQYALPGSRRSWATPVLVLLLVVSNTAIAASGPRVAWLHATPAGAPAFRLTLVPRLKVSSRLRAGVPPPPPPPPVPATSTAPMSKPLPCGRGWPKKSWSGAPEELAAFAAGDASAMT